MRIATADGELDARVALPARGGGPGLVLLHEIFGVDAYVRDAARRLAGLGYVVLAPDLYWRTQPGLEVGPDDLRQAFDAAQRLDQDRAVDDALATLAALRALAQTDGRAGVLGFCLGGTLAWRVAAQGDPDVCVSYYGSGVPDLLDEAAAIDCPTLLHFGGADPYIPRERVDAVAALAAARAGFECHVQEGAGHAFDNSFSPLFSDPPAAAAAWELTVDFLRRTLPAR